MPAPTPAVFLSYASQDAEAATRIAASLRSAGIEVWFDVEGGLEQGDEWDAKIRNQIKDCVLFIAVVSANTEARHEGYFRIEWDLAAERARGIASGVAFILPVTIDDTNEQTALVPDRFKAVQWTKLPDGDVSDKVQARFLKLWSHRTGTVTHPTTTTTNSTPTSPPTPARRSPQDEGGSRPWLIPVIAGAIALVALLVWQPWQSTSDSAHPPPPPILDEAGSESQQLVAQAWEQLNKVELYRAELDVADELCRRATELDPQNADAWAAWSQVDSWHIYHNFDFSSARREGARTKAARALKLAPQSYEARLAQACYMVRGRGVDGLSKFHHESETLLRGLLQGNPGEIRALSALGILLRNNNEYDEMREVFQELTQIPSKAAGAWNELGWAEWKIGNEPAAQIAADRSIAIQPFFGNLTLKATLAQLWTGDLDEAIRTFDQISFIVRQEDWGILIDCDIYYYRREPDRMLERLNDVSRDWLTLIEFDGPKASLAALAHEMAGRSDSAQVQLQIALELVNQRLIDQPDSSNLLGWKGEIQARLGQLPEAEKTLKLADEMRGSEDSDGTKIRKVRQKILIGQHEHAITLLEQLAAADYPYATAANLRLSPDLAPLRSHPGFKALQARLDADPRYTPNPKAAPAAVAEIPEKSIAVLPLANMSPDDAHAFFADGVQEDILTNLSKIEELLVISRTSTQQYRKTTKTARQIGEELGIRYLVEGSVRRAGDRVLVTVLLIDSHTGQNIWAEKFNRTLDDIFAIQAEIATAIAGEIHLKISPSAVAQIKRRPTDNQEAYDLYVQARHMMNTGEGGTIRQRELWERIVQLDPRFAEAWSFLSSAQIVKWRWGSNRGDPSRLAQAEHALAQAIEHGPDLPHTAFAQAQMAINRDDDVDQRLEHLLHALSIDPNFFFAKRGLGSAFTQLGRLSEAQHYLEEALREDPASADAKYRLALVYISRQKWDEARSLLQDLRDDENIYGNGFFASEAIWVDFLETGDLESWIAASDKLTGQFDLPWIQVEVELARRDFASARLHQQQVDPEQVDILFTWVRTWELRSALIGFLIGEPEMADAPVDDAITRIKEMIRENPAGTPLNWSNLALAHALNGDRESMERALSSAREQAELPDRRYNHRMAVEMQVATAYSIIGDEDRALEALEAAREIPSRYFFHRELVIEPIYDRLRGSPRFDALLEDSL